ncbi:amidase [Nonomuraea turkmeniaca]|uniref:Amidase n=1 Tax=Nonomuraea turkmeniaca TaxID=103838 RepID=A0A5S4FLE2_9ACTN|nr:amidase [Nonomuraea turkmeniaca]TMR21546.1 amidase [Nonomuraea turkmeniaca]
MSEIWEMSATELARLIRSREVSSREAVEAHLRRIDEVNPQVNAVSVVLAEEALADADAADRAGGATGPLTGVPMTVKENIDVAGSATTLGIVPLRDAIAPRNAPHIAELRAAGAIPIGRTNMPEFGMRWHTTNDLHGPTRNPWSAAHTPGGSSGGDAAAVATGMAPLGMGNDGAGSLRWPAQCCGVTALRPSLGRVAQGGSGPTPFAFQLLAVHGPIARRVEDLRLAFTHMCGDSGGDPWHVPVPLQGPPITPPIRVRLATDPDGPDLAPDVASTLNRAAGLLRHAGYVVEESAPPALTRAGEIYFQIMSAYGRVHEEQPPVESVASEEFVRFWAAFESHWTRAAGRTSFDPLMVRAQIARSWAEWMTEAPLVLAPIFPMPAFPVGSDLDAGWLAGWPAAMRMAVAVNLLGLPSVAVPVGVADGLPQGVQIIAPRFREDLCLDAAAAIEGAVQPLTPIDPREHATPKR